MTLKVTRSVLYHTLRFINVYRHGPSFRCLLCRKPTRI